jgi:gliding motility-associated-like protein
VPIVVLPTATVTVPPDTVLCPGATQAFRLRAAPAGGTWAGAGVSAGNLFTPSLPGTTVLTYTVNPGTACPVVATRRVTLLAMPTLAPVQVLGACVPSAVAPVVVHYRQPATGLLADAVLTWDFGDDSPAVTGLDVTHTYLRAGTFRPRVMLRFNQSRCEQALALAPVVVEAMLIPNAFTPNNDAHNDFFEPRIGGCPPRLQVFSRWGQQVYESAAYQNNWGGAGLAPGTYYYLLTPPDGTAPIKGWVELLR